MTSLYLIGLFINIIIILILLVGITLPARHKHKNALEEHCRLEQQPKHAPRSFLYALQHLTMRRIWAESVLKQKKHNTIMFVGYTLNEPNPRHKHASLSFIHAQDVFRTLDIDEHTTPLSEWILVSDRPDTILQASITPDKIDGMLLSRRAHNAKASDALALHLVPTPHKDLPYRVQNAEYLPTDHTSLNTEHFRTSIQNYTHPRLIQNTSS